MSATPDPHKPLRDDVRLLGELLGQAIRAREGDQSVRPGGARPGPRQERPVGRQQRLRHAGVGARRDAARRGPAGRPRLLAVPQPGQHRRAAPPHPAAPRLPAVARPAAAARLVRGDLRPADRRRADAGRAARRRLRARDRAGADGASDRDRPPHAAAEVRPHRPGPGREGSARPDGVGARDGGRDAAPRDRRLLGDRRDPARPADAARRGPRRAARLRADAVAGAAALPARAGSRPARSTPARACRSRSRRSASARGSAAIATATRTSRRT